jgi:hypothetical protein
VDPDEARVRRVEALHALERRDNLFAHRVDGWSAWRVMRNTVHRMTQALPLAAPVRSDAVRTLRALRATVRLLGLLLAGRRRDIVVKTSRTGLRMAKGGRFRDVYFDGLLERGHTCLKLEEINSPDFDRQAALAIYPSGLDPVVFTFWGKVLGSLFPVDAAAFCEKVSQALSRECGIDASPGFLRLRISTVFWQARILGLLLRRLRPRAVLVSDTGEYALCVACRRQGIRFIELQHGVFDEVHPDAVPDWAEGTAAELLLPDVLASRGAYWVRKLAATRQGNGIAVPVGDEQVDLARNDMRRRRPNQRLHIVVTSQGLDTQRLSSWISDLIAAAPAGVECRVSLKMHPSYDSATTAYERLKSDPRVRIVGGGELPGIFDLLTDADLHLSIASACHFDAASLGVPTGVIPLAGHEQMLGAVDGERIVLVGAPAEAWALAAHIGVDPARGREFVEPGFLANLERLLTSEARSPR